MFIYCDLRIYHDIELLPVEILYVRRPVLLKNIYFGC